MLEWERGKTLLLTHQAACLLLMCQFHLCEQQWLLRANKGGKHCMITAELGRKSVQWFQGTGAEVTSAEPYLIHQSKFVSYELSWFSILRCMFRSFPRMLVANVHLNYGAYRFCCLIFGDRGGHGCCITRVLQGNLTVPRGERAEFMSSLP